MRTTRGLKDILLRCLPILDLLAAPCVFVSGWVLRNIRWLGVHRFPVCKAILLKVGVFPIRNHYYEPQFDNRYPDPPYSKPRTLPGIDWNLTGQLALLDRFKYAGELESLFLETPGIPAFAFDQKNIFFGPGDAEFWYQLIRAAKPARIIEIGSGHSTLVARKALQKNHEEVPGYSCEHICVEPYEMPWLERTGVQVVRKRVEEVGTEFFSRLGENDILFIDSSHVIRPQGDVLFEYLQLLPTLGKGVYVHIHDIFSPRNYPARWLTDDVKFWNEQYVLEAFLSQNPKWEVVGPLHQLSQDRFQDLKRVCPYITPGTEPASFYIRSTL